MAGFLYFAPKVGGGLLSPGEQFALGWPEGLDLAPVTCGPCDLPGVLGIMRSGEWPAGRRALSPEIRWCETLGGKVGMWPDWRPGPQDLARAEQIDGNREALGGFLWLVPSLFFNTQPTLPQVLTVSADGKAPVWQIRAEYDALCNMARDYVEARIGVVEMDAPAFEALTLQLFVQCLALNYNVGLPEVLLLGLVERNSIGAAMNVQAVLDRAVDLELWARIEAQKKTDAGETLPSSDSGAPG